MNIWEGLLLGGVQGATEFLPVSSSGHLFLLESYLNLLPNISLEIWLHISSLLAIVICFHKAIKQIFCELFTPNSLGLKLMLSTVMTVPIALLIENKIFEGQKLSLELVGGTLVITGILILGVEGYRKFKGKSPEIDFSWNIAFWLGVVQGIAALPGISRSGLTIAFLILLGLNRKKSAEISFLLAIPTILGALVLSLSKESQTTALLQESSFWAAFIMCFIISIFSIKFMMQLVKKNWIYFAPYCLILGGLIFINN